MRDNLIYRNFSLERLSNNACIDFLQGLAKCNGHITSSFCLNNSFPDKKVRYMSMFFRIYFYSMEDLEKFHNLGMFTEEIEKVSVGLMDRDAVDEVKNSTIVLDTLSQPTQPTQTTLTT